MVRLLTEEGTKVVSNVAKQSAVRRTLIRSGAKSPASGSSVGGVMWIQAAAASKAEQSGRNRSAVRGSRSFTYGSLDKTPDNIWNKR